MLKQYQVPLEQYMQYQIYIAYMYGETMEYSRAATKELLLYTKSHFDQLEKAFSMVQHRVKISLIISLYEIDPKNQEPLLFTLVSKGTAKTLKMVEALNPPNFRRYLDAIPPLKRSKYDESKINDDPST